MRSRPGQRGLTRVHVVILLAISGAALVAVSSLATRWRSPRTRDIAAEAKDYLRERHVKPLDVTLDKLLAESGETSIPTLPHPLLSKPAPDFELRDHTGRVQKLSEQLAKGPVVVVFYLGYFCNHCVSQLFALEDDIARFHKLGAEVIAISPDSPDETGEKFAKYGMFSFPVLAGPGNKTAAAYSVYGPPATGKPNVLLHGTFVIDPKGTIVWCHYGPAPFTSNATLLVELAKSQRQLSD